MAHEKLVRVYEGLTTADVDRLADLLNQAGIESFMDLTDAPIDGLVMGPSSKILRVHIEDAPHARRIVRQFERAGYVGVHGEDAQQREQTGFELPSEQLPSQDSPSPDVEGAGIERMDADRSGPEAPEVEGLVSEDPDQQGRVDGQRIVGFGTDRPLAQQADVESEDFESQRIDELNAGAELDEPETGRPAAELRPEDAEPSDADRPSESERRVRGQSTRGRSPKRKP